MSVRSDHIIAVDFDGTLVQHTYPLTGHEVPDAVRVVRRLMDRGDRIILYTMRSGKFLDTAVAWMTERGIAPWAVNSNPHQKSWTQSPKAYAHIYIDDAALGCPLVYPADSSEDRPYVDWPRVEQILFGDKAKTNAKAEDRIQHLTDLLREGEELISDRDLFPVCLDDTNTVIYWRERVKEALKTQT